MKRFPNSKPRSMPCPRCGKLISANTGQCIHCGLRRPGLYVSFPILDDLLRDRISFVDPIILVCFALYVLSLALNARQAVSFNDLFSMLAPTNDALLKLGMSGYIPVLFQGRWWSLITATYLHGSILHILFNMLWLRRIGFMVEELFGPSRFIILYTVAGVTGSLLSVIAGTPYFIGASGAIFGLFGALVVYGWRRGGVFGSNVLRESLIWGGISLVFGFIMPNVDNWGHIGGLIGGVIMALVLGYQERVRQKLGHHVGALVTLLVIVVCYVCMVIAFIQK